MAASILYLISHSLSDRAIHVRVGFITCRRFPLTKREYAVLLSGTHYDEMASCTNGPVMVTHASLKAGEKIMKHNLGSEKSLAGENDVFTGTGRGNV